MPVVQLPDGKRVKFPDGMSEDAINQALAGMVQSPPDAPSSDAPAEQSYAAGLLDQFTQGALAEFGDEATALEAALLGRTPGGDWFDYSQPWSERYNTALEAEREQQKQFEAENPVASTLANVGGAVATAMTPVGAVGQAVGAPLTAANLGRAALAGAGYGSLYGYGEGEGGAMNRLENVPLNAAIGAGGGVAGNVLQAGAGRLSRALGDPNKARARSMGVRPETYRIARRGAEMAEADVPGGAVPFIRNGGPDAMIGDVMPGQLDYVTNVGAGAPIARGNLNARVDRASGQVTRALDDTLGTPQGVRQSARDIAGSTRQARATGYEKAYNTPIDYAADTGRRIEGILTRIPTRTLREAVDEANEAMTVAGARNRQVMIDIADDGSVAFREMPNVQQLDEIKKALQTLGRENVDQFGRPTARGNRANALARELRDAIGEAVPEYNAATAAGADKIAQDQALDLGQRLLSPSITKEMADEAGRTIGQAERARAEQGIRIYLDELLGNMRMARTDPNLDQREAWAAIQKVLTRNNQEKMRSILGREKADALFGELNEAARAFNVRGSAARNSATEGRRQFTTEVEQEAGRGRLPDRPVQSVIDWAGSVPARLANAATGRTEGAIARRQDIINRELAELLTGLRGDEAVAAFQRLISTQAPPVNYIGPYSRRLAAASRLAAPPAFSPPIQP